MTAVVTRSSRVSATLGPTIYSHAPASLDLIGNARLLTNVATRKHHLCIIKLLDKFLGSICLCINYLQCNFLHLGII